MSQSGCEKKKDRRVLVLLALGGAILAAGWLSPTPQMQSGDYFLSPPGDVVYRTVKEISNNQAADVQLSAETPCALTPPELALFFAAPLPINGADHEALTMLPGIGPKLADSMIAYRSEHGRITGLQTLVQVDGIGENLTRKLGPLVCFD